MTEQAEEQISGRTTRGGRSRHYFDGVYWAVSTMTTVGYGDELPTTVESKVIAMVLMLVGIGYFAVITGAIAERFIETGQEEHAEAIEAKASDDLAAQVDHLALSARELVQELDALRLAIDDGMGRRSTD